MLPALLLVCAACRGAPVTQAAILSPGVVEEPVSGVLTAALAADSRLERADSLWDPGAPVIADGELRGEPPRFAGIGPGGQAAISVSRLEVRQSLVWVYLEYRWISTQDGTAREGRATVLLTPRGEGTGWKIVHAHSSSVREPET